MSEDKNAKNRRLLEKYLADKSKTLLWKDERDNDTSYEFQDWVKELPDEQRVRTTSFTVYNNGEVFIYRSTSKHQKFLCVNGPLVGEKITEETAKEKGYFPFNRATMRWGQKEDVPRVVLIHRDSLGLKKKAKEK